MLGWSPLVGVQDSTAAQFDPVVDIGVAQSGEASAVESREPAQASALDSLSLERLRLEIEQLRVETGAARWSPWLSTGTLIAALVAAAISLFTALRAQRLQVQSLKSQLDQAREDRITRLLEQLGHEEATVRAGVALALGRLPNAVEFVATALEFEADATVQAAIRSALERGPPEGLAALVDVTKRLGERQRRLVNQLRAAGLKPPAVSDFTGVPLQVVLHWLEARPVPDAELDFNAAEAVDRERWVAERDELAVTIERVVRVATAVISYRAERSGHCSVVGAYLPAADFSTAVLGESRFDGCALWNSSFDFVEARGSSFRGAHLSGARVTRAALHDSDWSLSRIDDASFRRSRLARAKFSEAEGRNVRFDGAKIAGASFTRSRLEEPRFNGAMGEAPSFAEAILFRAHFTSAVLTDANLSGADLRGARFGKAQMRRANFSLSRLAGNVIGGADLRSSSFDGATVGSVKGSDSAQLDGATARDTRFQSGAEHLQAAIPGLVVGGPDRAS